MFFWDQLTVEQASSSKKARVAASTPEEALDDLELAASDWHAEADFLQVMSIIGQTHIIIYIGLIGRAKRAPHWGVQSRFRVIYIYMLSVCLSYVKCESNTRMLKVSIGR